MACKNILQMKKTDKMTEKYGFYFKLLKNHICLRIPIAPSHSSVWPFRKTLFAYGNWLRFIASPTWVKMVFTLWKSFRLVWNLKSTDLIKVFS